jgi:hypothetical protein
MQSPISLQHPLNASKHESGKGRYSFLVFPCQKKAPRSCCLKKLTFQFTKRWELCLFWTIVHRTPAQVKLRKRTLSCACSDTEIELAEKRFGASVAHKEG